MQKKILSEPEIRQRYLVENKTLAECCQIFDCSQPTFLKACREYGISKPKPKKIDGEVREMVKRGVKVQDIADKLGVSKSAVKRAIKRNNLAYTKEQVGENIRLGLREHYRTNRIRVYGSSRLKKIKVHFRRQSKQNAFSRPEVKQKIAQTNIEKYGVVKPMQNESIKNRAIDKLCQTLADKYNYEDRIVLLKQAVEQLGRPLFPRELEQLWGITNSSVYIFVRKFGLEDCVVFRDSLLESEIETFLQNHNIRYEKHNRSMIAPQELDFYLPDYRVGLEVNDLWSHNSTKNSFGGEPKPKGYHYEKSVRCEESGIRLIHIWDYEWNDNRQRPILQSIILGSCNQAKTIFARKCQVEVRPSSSMKKFFEANNIQGFRGGKFAICLVYEGEVVMSYIMGKAFFGKGRYEWEVIRGATKLGYRVVGGASKIWKYFVRNYKPQSCVYYVDFNYFNGGSVPHLGFRYVQTLPSFKNYFVKKRVVKNRDPMHHKEIKELERQGLVWEIWNAGVKVFVWENGELG